MWKYISPLSVALLLIGSLIMLAFQPITYTAYENVSQRRRRWAVGTIVCRVV